MKKQGFEREATASEGGEGMLNDAGSIRTIMMLSLMGQQKVKILISFPGLIFREKK